MSEPISSERSLSELQHPVKGKLQRIADRFPFLRRKGNPRKSPEEEIKEQLATAVVKKVISDIERDGYTIRSRSEGTNGYITERLDSGICYKRGDKPYNAFVTAVQDMPGKPYQHTSRMALFIDVRDGNKLDNVSEGKQRKGAIRREVYLPAPDDPSSFRRSETGSVNFTKLVKGVNAQGDPYVHMQEGSGFPDTEINDFLRELLEAPVDTEATQRTFENNKKISIPLGQVNDAFWNRERPGELTKFFASMTP